MSSTTSGGGDGGSANSSAAGSISSNSNLLSIAMMNNQALQELLETKSHSQYLQSKINTSFESVKISLKEATDKKNSSKIYTLLQNLTYYKVDKDFLDIMLSIISISDDKKTLRLAYYFLIEISLFKHLINSSADIKNITNIFNKEMNHKDISRKVISLKTTALVAPTDVLVDANILEVISGILRKVGEDPDKTQKKKGFFSRATSDLGRERSLLQYACFVACRNRFKNNPSLFMPIVEGIKCSDPVGARHAVQLTYDYALENPSTVSATTKRFIPLLKSNKGKEAVNLVDPFARRNFIKLCGHLGTTPENKDFFQSICQSVMDSHLSVSFWAISTLCNFSWPTLESAVIEQIILDNDTPNHYEALPHPTSLITGICNKMKSGFSVHTSSTGTQQSNPFIHLACKLISSLSQSFVKYTYPKDSNQNPIVGDWTFEEKSLSSSSTNYSIQPNINSASVPSTNSSSSTAAANQHPFNSLTSLVISLLNISNSISIRIQSLKALVWLCPSNLESCKIFQDTFRAQLRDPNHPPHLFKELFLELYKRIIATPILSPMVLALIYDWVDIVPFKVDINLIIETWKVVIGFGLTARERLLQSIFKILDRPVHSDFRVISLEIQKDIIHFLGDYANVITYENSQRYEKLSDHSGANKSLDISNRALNSIILRLEQYAIYNPWQIRVESIEALAKIAFLSCTSIRIHIYSFLTSVPNESHGWTSVKTTASIIINILDQLLNLRAKWLPILKKGNSLQMNQVKDLKNDHNSLCLQIGLFFDSLSSDYLPLCIETKNHVLVS